MINPVSKFMRKSTRITYIRRSPRVVKLVRFSSRHANSSQQLVTSSSFQSFSLTLSTPLQLLCQPCQLHRKTPLDCGELKAVLCTAGATWQSEVCTVASWTLAFKYWTPLRSLALIGRRCHSGFAPKNLFRNVNSTNDQHKTSLRGNKSSL